MSEIILLDGRKVYTGLLVPPQKPMTFARLWDAMFPVPIDDIRAILDDPGRTPARQLFPPSWIKHQGSRGSCNGYAGAKSLERARFKRGLPHVELSGEFLYAAINGGRDVGSMLDDGMQWIESQGVCEESLVQHEEYLWSRVSQEAKENASRYKAVECYRADTEQELADGLARGFVGVVAVHAGSSYMSLDANGVRGVSNTGPGNHAVGVQDCRWRGGFQFDEFGSWGTANGQAGCAWLTWERHLKTTVNYHAFYLIRSTSDDSRGENPPEVAA